MTLQSHSVRKRDKAGTVARISFRRRPLDEQIADNIRELIRAGNFAGRLPSERDLCRLVNVSRPILRRALHHLRDEGLLHITRGRVAGIAKRVESRQSVSKEKRVILLYSKAENFLSRWMLAVVDEILHQLSGQQMHFEMQIAPALGGQRMGGRLQKVVERRPADTWILAGASPAAQEWFQNRALKTIIMGDSFPGICLPFVNDDQEAATRHAANALLGMKHRNIAYLMRVRGRDGAIQAMGNEAGFRKACSSVPEVRGHLICHDARTKVIRENLKTLFTKHPEVTGLIVSHAEDVLTTMGWLLEKGIQIPRDVSLISRQWAGFLEHVHPLPASYFTDPREHARKLCRFIFSSGQDFRAPQRIFPKFLKNETLTFPAQ